MSGGGFDARLFPRVHKIHILYHAAQEPVYGAELIEELAWHGYDIGPGTLYPTLHRLYRRGYLAQESRVGGGRSRKYYAIIDQGQVALEEARRRIAELVGEVLEEQD